MDETFQGHYAQGDSGIKEGKQGQGDKGHRGVKFLLQSAERRVRPVPDIPEGNKHCQQDARQSSVHAGLQYCSPHYEPHQGIEENGRHTFTVQE